jgi:uncharacterized membrane protein (Fun14 family)
MVFEFRRRSASLVLLLRCGTEGVVAQRTRNRVRVGNVFRETQPRERILCDATPKMSVFFLCKGSCYRGDGTKTSDKPVRFLWFSTHRDHRTQPHTHKCQHTHTHTPISYTMFARVRLLHSRTSRHPCHVPFGTTTPSQQRPILQVFSRQFTSAVIRTASRTNLRQRMCFLARSSSSFVRLHFSPRGGGGVVDTRVVAFFFVFLLFLTHGGLPLSFSPCVFSSTDASTLLNRGGNTTARASGPITTAAGVAATAGGLYMFSSYPMWFERPSTLRQVHAAEADAAATGHNAWLSSSVNTAASSSYVEEATDKALDDTAEGGSETPEDKGRMSLGTQVGFGALLGFAAGMALRNFGNALLAVLGAQFIWVQYMSWRGYLTVHWDTILERTANAGVHFDLDTLISILTVKIPFKAAFLTAFFGIARPYFQQFY